MDVDQIIATARSALSAKRVYGEPIERDGVTVVPAARVSGGGGGGTDGDARGGGGGGFGMHARPAGALIVTPDGRVRWSPFVDVNRIVLGGQVVAVVYLVTRWLTRRGRR